MLRKILIFGACALTAAALPTLYERNKDTIRSLLQTASGPVERPMAETSLVAAAKSPEQETLGGRKVRLSADVRGHYVGDFKLNGRKITGMIDTGATYVAINMSTARKIGLKLKANDFKYPVDTANGKTMAAAATIDTLQIGRIIVQDVQTVVLNDKALAGTLIGASFLNRLDKFQVEDGSLVLVQ